MTDDAEVQRLEEEVGALRRVMEITGHLNSTLELDELLRLIMSSASELLGAETSSLLLVDEETGDLVFELSTGEDTGEVAKLRVPAGQGVAGWVVEHGEAAIVGDPRADERFYAEVDRASGFETRSMLALPLTVKDKTIGVVEVINKEGGFDERDLELATALAHQAAIAIANARLYARLADAVVASRMSYRL